MKKHLFLTLIACAVFIAATTSYAYCPSRNAAAFVNFLAEARQQSSFFKTLEPSQIEQLCLCYSQQQGNNTDVCLQQLRSQNSGAESNAPKTTVTENSLDHLKESGAVVYDPSAPSAERQRLEQEALERLGIQTQEEALRANRTFNEHGDMINPTDGTPVCSFPQKAVYTLAQGWRCQ